MDRMPFRPKPKIVDLTSERKLADKVAFFPLTCAPSCCSRTLFHMLAQSGREACSNASSVISAPGTW